MQKKLTIATASLAAVGAVGVAPTVADAALAKGNISGQGYHTAAEIEAELPSDGSGGISPDLCKKECTYGDGVWGAMSHADEDGLQIGGYSAMGDFECEQVYPSATRGKKEWFCYGYGYYGGERKTWTLWLSPYGVAVEYLYNR